MVNFGKTNGTQVAGLPPFGSLNCLFHSCSCQFTLFQSFQVCHWHQRVLKIEFNYLDQKVQRGVKRMLKNHHHHLYTIHHPCHFSKWTTNYSFKEFSLFQSNCPWAPSDSHLGAFLWEVSASPGEGRGEGRSWGRGGKNNEIHWEWGVLFLFY